MSSNLADEPSSANVPWYQSRDDLADEPSSANDPPSTRAEMTCIPLHKTWLMNLLWPMDPLADKPASTDGPPVPEQRCLAYQYTQLGR